MLHSIKKMEGLLMYLETERLIIRSIRPEDEQAFIEMASDGSLTAIYGDCSECHKWMGEFINDAMQLEKENNPYKEYLAYTVAEKGSRKAVGSVGCSYYEDMKEIGITYFIGAGFRGNGYGAEAVQTFVKNFFLMYEAERLIAVTDTENKASCRTLEKAGFTLLETRLYQDMYDEKERMSSIYEIVRLNPMAEMCVPIAGIKESCREVYQDRQRASIRREKDELIIRENIEQYMQELKAWLAQTADAAPEEMSSFFTERIEGYEAHMSVWQNAYDRFGQLLPADCRQVLDLGCGTGLELDAVWKYRPEVAVTGVDLCQSMLDKLLEKYRDRKLSVVCADYFQYEFGTEQWDGIISFESLHHFLPEKKQQLYDKIYRGLKPGGTFLLGDYIACCQEEETLLRQIYLEKRRKFGIPEETFIHFDIPLTLEHEKELLGKAGFEQVRAAESINGAVILVGEKDRKNSVF